MGFTFLMPPTAWSDYSRLWMLLAILLLLLVLVPGIGREVNGSRRWLSLGGMTLQVSELAKVATVVFLASYFDKRRVNFGDDWRDWAEPLGVLLIPLLLLLMEPDFGSSRGLGCYLYGDAVFDRNKTLALLYADVIGSGAGVYLC